MDTLLTIYHAITSADMVALADPKLTLTIYFVLFAILFFENGVLPAAFLPGDSLLFLTGLLISQGAMHFGWVNVALIAGAGFGTWLGYLLGLWLGNTKLIKGWMEHLPKRYHEKTHILFHKYGLQALFIGRFIPFVRTALPMMAGISGLHSKKFHIYNWVSATLWIFLIVFAGYIIGGTWLFEKYKTELLKVFTFIPIFLLVLGLITSIYLVIQRKRLQKKVKSD